MLKWILTRELENVLVPAGISLLCAGSHLPVGTALVEGESGSFCFQAGIVKS